MSLNVRRRENRGIFIGAIVIVSLVSRIWRTTELRVTHIELDADAERFIREAADASTELRILPNHPDAYGIEDYDAKERVAREDHQIPDEPLLFLEVNVRDSSNFSDALRVKGVEVEGGHRLLRAEGTAIPNAIAALLLHLRDMTGKRPHAYFNWSEGNPVLYLIRYVLSGKGDVAPVTREVLRQAEPDPELRPAIHAAM